MRYETRGFDEYVYIYDDKNKMVYYSAEMGYTKADRVLYNKSNEKVAAIEFSCTDIDELLMGYPIRVNGKTVGYYDDAMKMENTSNCEFVHITDYELSFIEKSERLTFREYEIKDEDGNVVMKVKRSGTDFVCDLLDPELKLVTLLVVSAEFWHYITTTRDY